MRKAIGPNITVDCKHVVGHSCFECDVAANWFKAVVDGGRCGDNSCKCFVEQIVCFFNVNFSVCCIALDGTQKALVVQFWLLNIHQRAVGR